MSSEPKREEEHIYPKADYIEHELDEDKCVCGPMVVPMKTKTGMIGWKVTHYALDGRETRDKR